MSEEKKPDGPYMIADRRHLYHFTRLELIQEYEEAVKEYRLAKQRVMAIRFSVRGLSMLVGQPIPGNMDHGPILPEERMHTERNPNLAPRAQLLGSSERKGFDHQAPITSNKPDATK